MSQYLASYWLIAEFADLLPGGGGNLERISSIDSTSLAFFSDSDKGVEQQNEIGTGAIGGQFSYPNQNLSLAHGL
jgi:hypothetical protein